MDAELSMPIGRSCRRYSKLFASECFKDSYDFSCLPSSFLTLTGGCFAEFLFLPGLDDLPLRLVDLFSEA